MKISAFVLAAGLGTRLYPLTADKPKALVCYRGKPLLDIVIGKIIDAGIHDIVVNVHHFADLMIEHLHQQHYDARIHISDERAYLRDTAGGLKFASPYFMNSDLILIYNVDILSTIDLNRLIHTHLHTSADVTLAVRNRSTSRYFIFNQEDMRLCGWHNLQSGEKILTVFPQCPTELAFSGIQVIGSKVLRYIPGVEKLSFTPFYVQQSSTLIIRGYLHQNDEWMDVGKYDVSYKSLT